LDGFPQTLLWEFTALPRFKGPNSKGTKGREMGGEERKKRRAGERGGEVRLPHSKFLDPPLLLRDKFNCTVNYLSTM